MRAIPAPPRMPKNGPSLNWVRSMLYWAAARLGDINALRKMNLQALVNRLLNKEVAKASNAARFGATPPKNSKKLALLGLVLLAISAYRSWDKVRNPEAPERGDQDGP